MAASTKQTPRAGCHQHLIATCFVRLLKMREQIAAHLGVHRYELAAELGVSERRVQDDLAILMAAGTRIRRVPRGNEIAEWTRRLGLDKGEASASE